MMSENVDLGSLPLRFSPPDGWRQPDPRWISLHQAFEPPADWKPYPGAPAVPPSWPWWEENGTSWFRYFRDRPSIPTRALGNWFSLAALGLFSFAVVPFALSGWLIPVGGIVAVSLIVLASEESCAPTNPSHRRHWSPLRTSGNGRPGAEKTTSARRMSSFANPPRKNSLSKNLSSEWKIAGGAKAPKAQ